VSYDARTNIILHNEELYENNRMFRMMVDNTIPLTSEEKEKSQLEVDGVYGT
jgi:hypothetical protein